MFWKCPECGLACNISNAPSKVFCPCGHIGGMVETEPIIAVTPRAIPMNPVDTRMLWRELHLYTQEQEWNPSQAKAWYMAWRKRIPSFGCKCKEHWGNIENKLPPDYSSEEAFFTWSVEAHNAVNKKLNKPIYSVEMAQEDRAKHNVQLQQQESDAKQ